MLRMGLRALHRRKQASLPSVPDESSSVLKAAGVSKKIRKETILDEVSLSFPKGKITAITGQNGAGKTTLAQILCGLVKQTKGQILLEGKNTRPAGRLREIYYCGNDTGTQFFTASAWEELLLQSNFTENRKERAAHLLKEFGLYAYRDTHPSAMSGGQKQRVAIAGVVAMRPDCLILDEATAMLDPRGREQVMQTIHRLNKDLGITVVAITHYMEEVVDADRVIVMDDGHIVMDGTPKEIFSRVEELKQYRMDVPQVTELAWELQKKGIPLPDGILRKSELLDALVPLLKEE